jgi:hypothetical protein
MGADNMPKTGILYCDRCARLIRPNELDQSLRSDAAAVCPDCVKSLSLDEMSALKSASLTIDGKQKSGRRHVRRPRRPVTTPAATGPSTLFMVAVIAAGIGIGVAAVVVLRSGDDGAPPPNVVTAPPEVTAPAVPTPAPVAAQPPAAAAVPSAARKRLDALRARMSRDGVDHARLRDDVVAFMNAYRDAPEAGEAPALLSEIDARTSALGADDLGMALELSDYYLGQNKYDDAKATLERGRDRLEELGALTDESRKKIDDALAAVGKTRAERERARAELRAQALRTAGAGIVGWWKLDEAEGDTVVDSSGMGHDGTISGANYSWLPADGTRGSALDFKNGEQILCAPSEALDLRDALTLAAWVSARRIDDYDGIVVRGTDKLVYSLRLLASRQLQFVSNGWGRPRGGEGSCKHRSKGKIDTDRWHHVAVTYDGTHVRFYIDGELDPSELKVHVRFGRVSEPLAIGCDPPGGVERLDGALDDVRVYNRALSANEIAAIHAGSPLE